jgi:hypothetical protein
MRDGGLARAFAAVVLAGTIHCTRTTPAASDAAAAAPEPAAVPEASTPSVPVVESLPQRPPPPSYGLGDGGNFEGEIDMKLTSTQSASATIQYFVKSPRSLTVLNLKGTKMRWLVLPEEGHGYEISDATKQYIRVEIRPPSEGGTNTVALGTLEPVAGTTCEDWELTRAALHFTGCIVRGLGPFDLGRSLPAAEVWRDVLAPRGYSALRMVSRDELGNEEQRIEATRIQRQKLADAMFTLPAGYTAVVEADDADSDVPDGP